MSLQLFDRSTEGRFELTDRDRLDLLHRMSTNDLTNLGPGEGRATVLTTALARIIDHLIVYNRGEVALAVCGEGRVATVRGWLQRHIFFQDKVKTRDVSGETCQYLLAGVGSGALLDQIAPGADKLALHHFLEAQFEGAQVLIARSYPVGGESYTLIAPAAQHDALRDKLLGLGDVKVGTAEEYERLRIEAGLPAANHELTEEYIPLEAGLWDAVSFRKGCYIGQEIIARMESRGKLARTLVQLRLVAPVPLGTALQSGDRSVGAITSLATLDDGAALALGYVRTDAVDGPLLAVPKGGEATPVQITQVMQPITD